MRLLHARITGSQTPLGSGQVRTPADEICRKPCRDRALQQRQLCRRFELAGGIAADEDLELTRGAIELQTSLIQAGLGARQARL